MLFDNKYLVNKVYDRISWSTLILVHLSVNKIVIYGHVILTSITIVVTLLSIICIAKERKQTLRFIQQWKKNHLNLQ
jgi:hypothetical protein